MKKALLYIMTVYVFCMISSVTIHAAGTYTTSGGTETANWAEPVKCHTLSNGDGTTTVLYSVWDGAALALHVDTFSASGQKLNSKKVAVPGVSWGGTMYHGPDGYTYIVTGNSSDVAFYVSKYSADWKLMGTAAIGKKESYTSLAFNAGNSDITMVGEYLIVHAARGRMDGHQSNTTFYINKNTMSPVYITPEIGFDHVSHSFNQFIRSSGNQVMMVDHGDAYPRKVVLQTYTFGSTAFGLEYQNRRSLTLIDIEGPIGANYTGVTADGFELGTYNHVMIGTSIPKGVTTSGGVFRPYKDGKNIYVVLIDKNMHSSRIKWLTSYNNTEIKNLECIKINDNCFFLLYGTEDKSGRQTTSFMKIDSNGTILQSGSISKKFYCTSEAAVSGDLAVWCHYVESNAGKFLVMNQWNIRTGKFRVYNIDTGLKSQIKKIGGKKKYTISSKKETSLLQAVYSDIFSKGACTIPAVWKSSNPNILEIVEEEKMVDREVIKIGGPLQLVSTKVKAKKSGTVKVTCSIGDKTRTIKVKVHVKDTKKKQTAPKTSITRLKKKGKKAVKISWKKKSGVSGYQICYASNKKFKKAKKLTIKKATTSSKTIKKRKRKDTLYIKIRTYKMVSKKGSKARVYSKWSDVKKCV